MALKVVPAGDERCDVHNARSPQRYVCETCLKEFGIETPPSGAAGREGGRRTTGRRGRRIRPRRALRRLRTRTPRWVLIGGGIGLVLAIAATVTLTLSGGGDDESGALSEAEVVSALDLLPNPAGSGWITSDGACAVASIDLGRQGSGGKEAQLSVEATNEDRTVEAVVVQNDFTVTQEQCVAQVETALRDEF
jgi:hypothetical protein